MTGGGGQTLYSVKKEKHRMGQNRKCSQVSFADFEKQKDKHFTSKKK